MWSFVSLSPLRWRAQPFNRQPEFSRLVLDPLPCLVNGCTDLRRRHALASRSPDECGYNFIVILRLDPREQFAPLRHPSFLTMTTH
jgi:hypothetical protein